MAVSVPNQPNAHIIAKWALLNILRFPQSLLPKVSFLFGVSGQRRERTFLCYFFSFESCKWFRVFYFCEHFVTYKSIFILFMLDLRKTKEFLSLNILMKIFLYKSFFNKYIFFKFFSTKYIYLYLFLNAHILLIQVSKIS